MFSYIDSVARTCKSDRPPSKEITLTRRSCRHSYQISIVICRVNLTPGFDETKVDVISCWFVDQLDYEPSGCRAFRP